MTLTVRLPESIESQLTRFCETLGQSKSQVVQSALKDWFAKPVPMQQHPLLAFADAAVNAVPSVDWPGPYSKERLRQQVLATGVVQMAAEPVANDMINRIVSKSKVAKKGSKKFAQSSVPQVAYSSQTGLA